MTALFGDLVVCFACCPSYDPRLDCVLLLLLLYEEVAGFGVVPRLGGRVFRDDVDDETDADCAALCGYLVVVLDPALW